MSTHETNEMSGKYHVIFRVVGTIILTHLAFRDKIHFDQMCAARRLLSVYAVEEEGISYERARSIMDQSPASLLAEGAINSFFDASTVEA